MSRWIWRARRFFIQRQALVDALEEAYEDCTRYRRERDSLADELFLYKFRVGVDSAPRSVP